MASTDDPMLDEVAAYERRLRRSAQDRLVDTTASGLTPILRHVSDRRTRRSPVRRGRPDRPERAEPPETREAPGTRATAGRGTGRIESVEAIGDTVRILRVGRPPGLVFRAGQHLKAGLDGQRRASFSIASAPHEPHLELCVELIAGGRLTPALFALAPGDQLMVGDRVKGGFRLDDRAQCHLMVATVTGIAPLRSMLRDALHRGVGGEFVVLHGASYADELPYADELTALADADPRVRYLPTVSRPTEARNQGWGGRTGRVDALARELASSLDPRATRVYACGNSGMVDRVAADLGAAGFTVTTETYD